MRATLRIPYFLSGRRREILAEEYWRSAAGECADLWRSFCLPIFESYQWTLRDTRFSVSADKRRVFITGFSMDGSSERGEFEYVPEQGRVNWIIR
jgi:hypothetical protein